MRTVATAPTGPRRPPCELVLMNVCPDSQIVGLHAVPNRLPEVLRLPGESLQALLTRALHLVTGAGQLVAWPITKP
jgi:hypothetical protein